LISYTHFFVAYYPLWYTCVC